MKMCLYLDNVLSRIPQILSQIDQEFFSKTYGCGDRVFWCWKFTDFPGGRFQEFVYTISWLYSATSFGNHWKGNLHLLWLIEAGLKYWCNIQYRDGSFDEAYPFEHSLAATAFTTFYLTESYELVKHDLSENTKTAFLEALDKASRWMYRNCETHGILSNHLAAAAAGLRRRDLPGPGQAADPERRAAELPDAGRGADRQRVRDDDGVPPPDQRRSEHRSQAGQGQRRPCPRQPGGTPSHEARRPDQGNTGTDGLQAHGCDEP